MQLEDSYYNLVTSRDPFLEGRDMHCGVHLNELGLTEATDHRLSDETSNLFVFEKLLACSKRFLRFQANKSNMRVQEEIIIIFKTSECSVFNREDWLALPKLLTLRCVSTKRSLQSILFQQQI